MLGAAILTVGAAACGGASGAGTVATPAPTAAGSTGPAPTSDGGSAAGSSTATATHASDAPAGQPTPADPPPPGGVFDPVIALVVERLDTADTVAAAKWITHQPVSDPAREAVVLSAATARAAEVGANADYVTAVFTDQITANKQAQQQTLDEWAAGNGTPPTEAPDLATQVRPALDRITHDLVPALAAVQDYRDDTGCAKILADDVAAATPPASAAGRAALAVAVAHLCDPA